MKRLGFFVFSACLAGLLVSCASQEPMVSTPPAVTVSNFKSVSFTPQRIEFDARVLIQNTAPVPLDLAKVDWAVDMFDQELFNDSFSGLKRTDGNGTQTVSLPFHIVMKDVTAQAPDLLAEGKLRVTFRGQVYSAARYGLSPVPFTQSIEIPIPKLPDVAYVGSEGEPFSSSFRLNFTVTNSNSFPIALTSVKTFLEISGRKYSLLHTRKSVDVQPGETQPVVLQMENSPGKALSMALNLAQNPNPTFSITGTVTFNTPYGWVFIPLNQQEMLQ